MVSSGHVLADVLHRHLDLRDQAEVHLQHTRQPRSSHAPHGPLSPATSRASPPLPPSSPGMAEAHQVRSERRVSRDEAGIAPHQLDDANALFARGGLKQGPEAAQRRHRDSSSHPRHKRPRPSRCGSPPPPTPPPARKHKAAIRAARRCARAAGEARAESKPKVRSTKRTSLSIDFGTPTIEMGSLCRLASS